MTLKKFTAILLRSISNSNISPLHIERYWRDNHSFCVTTADEQIFLVKIGEVPWQKMTDYEKNPDFNIAKQLGIKTQNDFLKIMDTMIQKNPLLMNLLFSTWKLRELNLITDTDLHRIQKGIEQNQDDIFIDFMQQLDRMK